MEAATPRRRALIIENYADALEGFRLVVESWGYDVEAVATGAEGLAVFAARVPDVVVIEPAVREGCDVIRQMKAAAPGVVVVANTGNQTIRAAAQQAGADVVILKPHIEALEEVLVHHAAVATTRRERWVSAPDADRRDPGPRTREAVE